MKKYKKGYIGINKNFELFSPIYIEKKISFLKKLEVFKKQPFIKITKKNSKTKQININFFNQKEKWLIFRIILWGAADFFKVRVTLPPVSEKIKNNIDRFFFYHDKTNLFFISEDNLGITDSKTGSTFPIALEIFLYFQKYGSFINVFRRNKKKIRILVTDTIDEIMNWIIKKKNFPLVHNKDPHMLSLKEKMIQEWKKNKENNEEIKKIDNLFSIRDVNETEKEQIIKSRINQHQFRNNLLILYDKTCPITLLNDPKVLIASHVKPWSKCEKKQKLDVKNGILLSPLFDKLFDRGLISFDENGRIIYSQKQLTPTFILKIEERIKNKKYPDIIKKKVNLDYLKYHREKVFQK